MTLTRRHILAGAAATVATAGNAAAAMAHGFLFSGNPDADVGDIYFDDESMDFFEMTDRGWVFLPRDAS